MTAVRSQPCTACPYRQDVPSGLWSADEYEKLRPYDNETMSQPFGPFMCHATPDHYCHGWAVCHTSRGNRYDLLALRLARCVDVPEAGELLFRSGNDAADWGQRDIENPDPEAVAVMERLMRKYPRLHRDVTP
jgi:hypothetical protein